MKEIWKSVVSYEGIYEVSNIGRVKSLKYGKEKIKKRSKDDSGHYIVCLRKNNNAETIAVHRLVAEAFIPIPEKYKNIPVGEMVVHHIDCNPINNVILNLEWLTPAEHMKLHRSKPVYSYNIEGYFVKEYISQKDAEKKTGTLQSNISKCCCGEYVTAGGFQWRTYKTNKISSCETKNEIISKSLSKRIEMLSLNLEHEEYFKSLLDCERQTGISHGNISQICNGRRKTAKTKDGKKHTFRFC